MTTPENPFDKTIWDTENPEHAIEDPFHGPSATLNLLSTPPMPMEDGTFWVFGGSVVVGTCTFDADGKPFNKFRAGSSLGEMMRFTQQIEAWHETIASGEMPDDYPENPAEFFDFTARPYFVIER